jgi:uncharacterized protein
MATLSFETLSFSTEDDNLVVTLLKQFITKIPLEELNNIAEFKLEDNHTLSFQKIEQEKVEIKFSFLLEKYFDNLTNRLNGNKTTYIHRNSGIPLMGNVAFGIVYRNSSIVEIKPITSCNLNCVYCSISEGLYSKKNDFVVEKDYLIEELENLLKFIGEPVEIHVGVQGEPFLYADMLPLIEDLQKMGKVNQISVDTNGILLNKNIINQLAKNDKLRLNFSLDALDEDIAKKMAGVETYNVQHLQEVITYASKKLSIIVAPVLVKCYNEEQIEKIIAFAKSLDNQPILGIQNFLRYKTGRNPGKEIPWEEFYKNLEELEQKHDIKLQLTKEDFNVKKTKKLEKPFVKGKIVNAIIKCPERFENSVIAVARGRNISIANCKFKKDKKIKVEITRDKHNVFSGSIITWK